jgi:hypothetical protein
MRRIAAIALLAALAGMLIARRRRARQTRPLEAPRARQAATAPAVEPRFVSVAWELVAAPQEQPELAIRCHQDDALVLDRVDVQETPTQVFVTALARQQPRTGEEPVRSGVDATVALSRPLGTRELIHTPVDRAPNPNGAGASATGSPGVPPLYP